MTALEKNPQTTNLLSPLNFKFQILRAPNVNFNVQKVNVPGFSIGPYFAPTPLVRIPEPGEHVIYETLDVVFQVDENLNNYLELFAWCRTGLGKPDELEQYAVLEKQPTYTQRGPTSEIILSILNSARNPNYDVYFHDAFPTSMSRMDFDTTPQGIDYVKCAVSFEYRSFDIEKVL